MKEWEDMMCGNCGGKEFMVYKSNIKRNNLLIVCNACNSSSIIKPSDVYLEIEFGPLSDGRLCPS